MTTYDTRVEVPICNLKKKTGFHVCYELEGVMHSIIKCWYDKDGNFLFYPNIKEYTTSIKHKDGQEESIPNETEKKHPRITVHQSGVIVGPDKEDRPKAHRYEKMKACIKECKHGVSLAVHKLAHPGHYGEIPESSKKKGNWAAFKIKEIDVQPVFTIDAYPIFNDSEIEALKPKKNHICGFVTKYFEKDYRILILLSLEEKKPEGDMNTHSVYIPVV